VGQQFESVQTTVLFYPTCHSRIPLVRFEVWHLFAAYRNSCPARNKFSGANCCVEIVTQPRFVCRHRPFRDEMASVAVQRPCITPLTILSHYGLWCGSWNH